MAEYGDGAASNLGKRLHVIGEAIDLSAINLTADEGARQRVDADVLRLEIPSGLIELAIKIGRLDPAASVHCAQRRILTEFAKHLEATGDQLLERHAIVAGNVMKPDVNFLFVVFSAEIKRRSGRGQRPKPILARDMNHILRHFDDALAGAAFT